VPNNLYATGDEQFIHITAASDPVFRRLAAAMGRQDLAADARFATGLARARNGDALDDIIAGWTTKHPLRELEATLEAAAVPATRIFTIADIFGDPHYRAREMLVAAPDEALGSVTLAGVVPRLSATPGEIRHAGRGVGADTASVLHDVLGLSAAETAALAKAGIVHCAEGR
jgi:crotonobetainyl-CoA:carnitine CoA-transferase CaiB-like acyl-CoA transferase